MPKRPPNIAIVADDGTPLANRGDTGGAAVKLKDLPPYLPKAFVAIEDRRFYFHHGIDPLGIARALTRNVVGSGGMQGGSTLTQQLAKNLFLTQERTVSRKIQEAILAIWLEHKYTKDQILELYLNRVYFGSGSYGVEAAANRYFGHGAKSVTLGEAAVLAGLMKAPTKLAPNRNPSGAAERAAQVIAAMVQEGYVTEAAGKAALAQPAHTVKEHGNGAVNYAADYVMDMLDDTIGAVDEDIVVSTTISPAMEQAGERALVDGLAKSGGKYGVSQGALVSLDIDGGIKALIGGRDYADSQFDRAVSAKRQPGSSFKPFVYLSALEAGLTPDSVREDGPITIKGWHPENYSREYFGPVTLTKALALSLNTVAVRLGVEVGPRTVVRTAHRLGITSDLQPNASISLGTSEVSPLELTAAYAPFANGGVAVQPHIITRVKTAAGKLLYQRRNANLGRAVDPAYVGDDERHDGGDLADRHGPQGGASRVAGGRQDRDQPGLARRLVRRLHEPARDRGLVRQRRRHADPQGLGRQPAGRDLEPLHEGGAEGRGARRRFRATIVRRPSRRPMGSTPARRRRSRAPAPCRNAIRRPATRASSRPVRCNGPIPVPPGRSPPLVPLRAPR